MKNKGLLIFSGIVFLFVAFVAYDYKSKEKAETQKEQSTILFKTSMDQVNGFKITKDDKSIELKKTDQGWMLVQPVQERAEQGVAEEFASGLINNKYIELIQEGENINWKTFGLDKPQGFLQLDLNNNEKVVFKISALSNFQGENYLQKNDEKKVYLIASDWAAKLSKKALDFRDKRWMRFDLNQISKLKIKNPQGVFEFIKKDDQWTLVNSKLPSFDPGSVQDLLQLLNYSEVDDFAIELQAGQKSLPPAALKKYGVLNPVADVSIEFADQKKWSGQFGVDSKKDHYLKTSQPEFVLKVRTNDSERFSKLKKEDFMDKKQPFRFQSDQVKRASLNLDKWTYDLNNQQGKWDLDNHLDTENNKLSVNSPDFEQMISFLSGMKASFYSPTNEDQKKLMNKLTLANEKNEKVLELQWSDMFSKVVGSATEEVYFLKSSLAPMAFYVRKNDFEKINFKDLIKIEKPKP